MEHQGTGQQCCRVALACVFACGLVLGQGGLSDASAGAIYSYIDDKGSAVYTDKLETIPEKYRAKVKVQQLSDPESKASSAFQSVQQTIKDRVKAFGAKKGSGSADMDVRSMDQDTILQYAGGAAVLLLLIMYLSKNSPMIRLLALALLILLGVGTPVLIYTSGGGTLDVMKQKATATSQTQQNRLQQVPQ